MNKSEAYSALGLSGTPTKEEEKKAFKKMAAKYHPDVNKDPDAEAQFKKVNEAWQFLNAPPKPQNIYTSNPGSGSWGFGGFDFVNNIDFEDLINMSNRANTHARGRVRKQFNFSDIELKEVLSFKESVLGCIKEIKYNRSAKCQVCEGTGEKQLDNGCGTCDGKGKIISKHGYTIMHQTCNVCHGKVNYEPCKECSSTGAINVEQSVTVNIPPGVQNNNTLSLGNRGNFLGDSMGMEQNSKVLIHMIVTPQDNLSIRGTDVIFTISIQLLEALQGCVKAVPTIDGYKEIKIPEKSKNKDEVIIPNLGVARRGNQTVILQIDYPSNTEELIKFLQKE